MGYPEGLKVSSTKRHDNTQKYRSLLTTNQVPSIARVLKYLQYNILIYTKDMDILVIDKCMDILVIDKGRLMIGRCQI